MASFKRTNGTNVSAKYFITGVGCLSASNIPKFKGIRIFKGEWYHTGHWPHEKVDFKGKRSVLLGRVQRRPSHTSHCQGGRALTVFQRTPQYSVPARNHPYDPEYIQKAKDNFYEIKQKLRESMGGIPFTSY